MSYNQCHNCGGYWGMINSTVYTCNCPSIEKIKGHYWQMKAIDLELYVLIDESRTFYPRMKFNNLSKSAKEQFFAEAVWYNYYHEVLKCK